MNTRANVESDTGVPGSRPPYARTIVSTRLFDAPRPLLWKVWTDPAHLAQWFGPQHFTNHSVELDLRVGGTLRLTMLSPQDTNHPMQCVFREIVPLSLLKFTNSAFDEKGNQLLEGLTTVTFEDIDGKTKVTLETTATGTAEITRFMLEGMKDGWAQSFDKLALYLPKAA